jgi:hypothetical protein
VADANGVDRHTRLALERAGGVAPQIAVFTCDQQEPAGTDEVA